MAIDKANVQNVYPLTPLQEGMYFHAHSDPDSAAYFEQWSLRVRGELRPELVRGAWNELFQRHEVFRSVFTAGDGKRPLQVILRRREVELATLDLSALAAEERQTRLDAARRDDRERGFQLGGEPLVRLLLVRLDEQDWEIVWSHHHIILDGWSVGVVQREFIEIYSARRAGREPQLARPFAFSRFVKSLPAVPDAGFWQDYLAGYENPVELPHRANTVAPEIRRHYRDLTTGDGARLDALCRSAGCTASAFIQAVWGILLARYANSDDVVFGYVFSGRPPELAGIDQAVGLFINTLPVRVQLRDDERFRDLLQRLHAAAAELTAHQHTPLALIQRACLEGGTLFHHVVALENYPIDEELRRIDRAATGFETVGAVSEDRTHYTFDLVVLPHEGGLRLRFSYDRAVHDEAFVERLAAQFLYLVGALLDDPDVVPCRLNILPTEQWRAVVEESNRTAARYPADSTIFDLFAAQLARQPDAPALLAPHGENRWHSYAELAQSAAALAEQLRSLGVPPGSRVALFLPPAERAIAAVLGVLQAGCAYVPIDPEYPPERVAYILEDSAARAIVTTDGVEATAFLTDAPPAAISGPDATAYIIYTSGSTGQPKGCEVTQRNVVRLVHNDRLDFAFGSRDVWVMAHSLSFDFSVWEIYGALLHGGRLVVPDRDTVRNVPDFHALLRRERVSVLNQTPLAFYNLIAFETTLAEHALDQHLRYVVFGGDRLSPAALRPWATLYPLDRVALINMYGITETTVHVTFCRLGDEHLVGCTSPIGRPLPETTVYVVDRHLNPQPLDAPGELVVGGSGVCKGYLNRPELTAERFVANLFGAGTLYRSGDLGCRTADGQLAYLGRNDQQVKIRGHRIEPAEIEQALTALPGVEKAAVLAETGSAGSELIAYVVADASPETLRAALATRLPAHMLPSAIVCCAAFPATANGKLDRRALRQLRDAASSGAGNGYAAPQGAQEKMLAEVWAAVLGVPLVGRHDRYLSLGGDSIKSIQILARLRAQDLNLQLKDLFRYPSVAELAPHLTPLKSAAVADSGAPFPLTPIQLRFFAEHPVEPHHFNHAVLLRCPAGSDVTQMQQALQALYDGHDAFRLRFNTRPDGAIEQRVAPRGEALPYSVLDLRTETAPLAALEHHASQEQRRLDPHHGPLLRAVQYRLADADRLLLIAHHLCIDGVSWRIVQEDLESALGQLGTGQPVKLPPPSDSFSRWSALLRDPQTLREASNELPYWHAMEETGGEIPAFLATPGTYGEAAESGFTWDAAASADLRRAGATYQTNAGELLLTALARALRAWTGLAALPVALENHGRDALDGCDVSRTVGWFTSLYPLRLDLQAAAPERHLKEIKETLRRVPRGGIGYGILRYLGDGGSGLSCQPPISFNYLGEFDFTRKDAVLCPCNDPVGAVVNPRGPRPFALEVGAALIGGELRVTLGYAAGQVDAARIRQLSDDLEKHTRQLVEHCLGKNSSELTPADLTYKGLSLDELDGLFDED